MKYRFVLIAILFVVAYVLEVQAKEGIMYPEEIRDMNRDGIILKAAETFKEESFKIDNFDRIKVLASENIVLVTFNMSIRFVPQKSEYFYGAAVDLSNRTRSLGRLSNPPDIKSGERPLFFTPTKQSSTAISFVTKLIGKPDDQSTMDIFDNDDFYEIQVMSPFQKSFYKIDKLTGQIFDEKHQHLAVDTSGKGKEIFREIQ